jgi:MFS family permease
MSTYKTGILQAIERLASNGFVVATAAFLIMAMFGSARASFGVFFKPVMNEFGWTRAAVSAAFSLAWVVHGLASIVLGRLADKFSSGAVLLVCGLFMGAGHILMSQTQEIWQLYLFYGVIIGIGGSVHIPVLSYINRRFTNRKSLLTGTVMAGVGAGQMISPLAAERLIAAYSWQTSYIILGIITMTVIILSSLFLRQATASFVYPVDKSRVSDREEKPVQAGYSLSKALASREFWMALPMFFCIAFCGEAIIVHIVPYITDLGIDATIAASVLSVIGIAIIGGRILAGNMADRIGNDITFLIGFIVTALALLMLLKVDAVWLFYLFAVVFALSWSVGILGSPLIANIFGLGSLGLILGVMDIGYTLGCALGPYIFGYIYDLAGSYHDAFILNIIVAGVGFVFAVVLTANRLRKRLRRTTVSR